MPTLAQTIDVLEQFAPLSLAEEWDNVGLLVGDPGRPVERLMTCLTVTPTTADEAACEGADLIVTHHPLPFRPLKRITADTTVGKLLLKLVESGIAVYSPHTAFDSAGRGINQNLADALQLVNIRPLQASVAVADPALGAGRIGETSETLQLAELAKRLKAFLNVQHVRAVGGREARVRRVALACGSGGSFLDAAVEQSADCLVTGETNFHTCLEADARELCVLLVGHFASERFAVELLARFVQHELPGLHVWASRSEQDPVYSI